MMAGSKNSSFFLFCLFIPFISALFFLTITNMSGIYIVSDLGGNTKTAIYPMIFFGLGNALSLPLTHRLAHSIGPIKLLSYCLFFFACFSLLCAKAETFFLFNVFRLFQGYSAGFFFVLSRNLILKFSPNEKKDLFSFLMVLCYATVPVFGACFGATVAYEYHWSYLFHFNIPIALFLAFYFLIYYRHIDPITRHRLILDKVGYILFILALTSLITAVSLAQELDWYRSKLFVFLVIFGLMTQYFFILKDRKSLNPLFDFRLFKRPLVAFSFFSEAIIFSTYFGMITLIIFWLKIYANYTPLWVNALIGIEISTAILAYFICFRFINKVDLRLILIFGLISLITSCYISTYFNPDVDFFHLALARLFSGLGIIFFLFSLFHLSQFNASQEDSDKIFWKFQFIRSIFSILGAGLYIILWDRRETFFYERLGEKITVNSPLTQSYFEKAHQKFHLWDQQAIQTLNHNLIKHATSLGLNDTYVFMSYVLTSLLGVVLLSFLFKRKIKKDN